MVNIGRKFLLYANSQSVDIVEIKVIVFRKKL